MKLTASTLFSGQQFKPDVQERVLRLLKQDLALTFIGCNSFTFDQNLQLVDAQIYDGTREEAGAVSTELYSLAEFTPQGLVVAELVRADFVGGKLKDVASRQLFLGERLSELQARWAQFYQLLSAKCPQELALLDAAPEHPFKAAYARLGGSGDPMVKEALLYVFAHNKKDNFEEKVLQRLDKLEAQQQLILEKLGKLLGEQ